MATDTLVSVEQYLRTAYSPDCDYVDGVVLERNVGRTDHSDLQTELAFWFRSRRRELGVWAGVEQRVQVTPTRFRVPDVCVVLGGKPKEQVITRPPFLCIEVLSPDDRVSETQQQIDDYLEFGVRYVWVMDPATRRAYVHAADGSQAAKDGILRAENPEIVVPLADLFADL